MAFQAVLHSPAVAKRIGLKDLGRALRLGWADFKTAPTHYYFLALIYPVLMAVGVVAALDDSLVPLVFPILSGAALLGPLTAIVLYEMSRQREEGRSVAWWQALRLLVSRAAPAIALLCAGLVGLFLLWLWVGLLLYRWLVGTVPDPAFFAFLGTLLSTGSGWSLILIGNAVGGAFALLVLACFLVSFQSVVDRNCGALSAVATSLQVFVANPLTAIAWGAVVVLLLAATGVTLFVGLAVVLPLLGHASWHLYRMTAG